MSHSNRSALLGICRFTARGRRFRYQVTLDIAQDLLWELYGISIAFAFRSFDRSLFTHLITHY